MYLNGYTFFSNIPMEARKLFLQFISFDILYRLKTYYMPNIISSGQL